MNERIILDWDSAYCDIKVLQDELRVIRSNPHFVSIMGDEEIERFKRWELSLAKRAESPFNVVIAGDFKRGKSTLINALIGDYAVPVNVLPETVTINQVSYGEDATCVAALKNGKKARLDIGELSRERLEKIMAELPAEIDYIDVKFPNELLKEIMIIDTPGTGEIFEQFDDRVADYLINADALIYVVSARSPLSHTEKDFIAAAVAAQGFARVFVALNMADSLESAENIEKVTEMTRERADVITPGAYVFPISALDEFCRLKNLNRPAPSLSDHLENLFEHFRASLQSDIILQRDVIKVARVINMANRVIDDMANSVSLLLSALNANISDLTAASEKYQNENSAMMEKIHKEIASVSSGIDVMRHEAAVWMSKFMSRIRLEIVGIKDNNKTKIGLLQKHFQFYLAEQIKAAISACTALHQKQIQGKMKDSAKSIALDITASFGQINKQVAENISEINMTKADIIAPVLVIAEWYFEPDTALGILLFGAAGIFRKFEMRKKQKDVIDPLLQSFDDIVESVLTELENVYEKIKKSVTDKLSDFYQSQIEQSKSAIEQAKHILESEEMKRDDITAHLNSAYNSITGLRTLLEKYQS